MVKLPHRHGLGGEFAVWTAAIILAGALSYFAYRYLGHAGPSAMSAGWLLPALTIACVAAFAALRVRIWSTNQALNARATKLEADIRAELAVSRAFEREFNRRPRAAAADEGRTPGGPGA